MATSRSLPESMQVVNGTRVRVGHKTFDYFAGCDYLGLAAHAAVRQAAATAAKQFGASVGASRFTTGNHPLLSKLETALTRFFDMATATVLPSGYLADLAATQALAGDFSLVLIDERSHPAVRDAARYLGARLQTFRHRHPADLQMKIRRAGRRARILVMTEGVFAFDGSLAPLRDYMNILPGNARLLLDDAHGAGVLGAQGRGSMEHWKLSATERAKIVLVISLSKAFGAGGGAVLGPPEVRRAILAKSPVFAGATPLSPPLAAAALAGVKLAQSPARRRQLWASVAKVRAALGGSGQPAAIPSPSPALAIFPESKADADKLHRRLVEAGIYPNFIHYPGGPESGFFRLSVSSAHMHGQITRLAETLYSNFILDIREH